MARLNPLQLIEQLRRRLIPSGTIIENTIRSGVWEGSLNSLNRVIQLAKVTILAQLLPPKEFGLLGVGFLTLAIFESFSQFGIETALIQQEDENVDRYLNTSWVLRIFRGVLLITLIFFIAPYAASLFSEPRATNIIRVLGLGPLLLGLKNPGVVYFKKNLQFHRRFVQILSGTAVNFIIAVALGFLLGSVWALVAGTVAGNIVSVIVSYKLHSYRPQFKFDPDLARELIDFGKWIFGGSIIRFLKNQGDDVFVGWFLGATPLAFYRMAYRFSNAPATELTSVINNIAFPSLSHLQDDLEKLRSGYFRTLRFNSFLVIPAAAGIALVAPSFVRVFLGEKWLPTIPVMQALAVWGGLRGVNSASGPVFYALSRPDLGFKLDLARVSLIALGIYFAADQFGLLGVAAVLIVAAVAVAPIEIYLTLRLIDGSRMRYLRSISHPVTGSVLMVGVLLSLKHALSFPHPVIRFAFGVVIGAVAYALYTLASIAVFDYGIGDDLSIIIDAFR
jgi:PST family polysaccharide transporter/lipopolysaccharide exporter